MANRVQQFQVLDKFSRRAEVMESINIDTEWPSHYQLPDPGNMMESHSRRQEVFANQGTSIANAILSCYSKYGPNRPFSENIILDFGCGVGRVVLPLCYTFGKPDYCVDVDHSAITYLRSVVPSTNPSVCLFEPPLSFPDESFDLVYSISVWTHLPADTAHKWLLEINRVLRPGGLAFLTTSNYAVLEQRRRHSSLDLWDGITSRIMNLGRRDSFSSELHQRLEQASMDWHPMTPNGYVGNGPSTCQLLVLSLGQFMGYRI